MRAGGGEEAGAQAKALSTRFGSFVAIDWSGAVGERHRGIAVALAGADGGLPRLLSDAKRWSRGEVLDLLARELPVDTLVGLDLGIALPFADCGAYFPGLSRSPPDAPALWALVDEVCAADRHFAVGSFADHPDFAPYFRRPGGHRGERFACDDAAHGRGRFRATEARQEAMGCRPYSNFNLVGAAQVGKASLTGMRLLHRLRGVLPVWPIDPVPASGSVVVEIYTTLAALAAGRRPGRSKMRSLAELNAGLAVLGSPPAAGDATLDDHSADALLTAAWLRANAARAELWHPPGLTPQLARTEGWTFGAR